MMTFDSKPPSGGLFRFRTEYLYRYRETPIGVAEHFKATRDMHLLRNVLVGTRADSNRQETQKKLL
jgi:hypothetical protein